MDEKSLIFGVSYAVDDLIMTLLKQNIDLNVEEDYYVNISPPPIPDSTEEFGDSVISGIFVDLTEDAVKAILGWLREREKEHMENPKLKISISGNLFNINAHDMEIIRDVLKECSKTKKGTK